MMKVQVSIQRKKNRKTAKGGRNLGVRKTQFGTQEAKNEKWKWA